MFEALDNTIDSANLIEVSTKIQGSHCNVQAYTQVDSTQRKVAVNSY